MPRNIEQDRGKKHKTGRKKIATYSFARMVCDDMGDFMSQYSSQTIFVFANGQDARENKDLPTETCIS